MYKDFKLVYEKPTTLKERYVLENNKGSKKTSFKEYQLDIKKEKLLL